MDFLVMLAIKVYAHTIVIKLRKKNYVCWGSNSHFTWDKLEGKMGNEWYNMSCVESAEKDRKNK